MKFKLGMAVAGVLLWGSAGVRADVFDGTLYFTYFTGGENVDKIDYSYNSATTTFTLGAVQGIAAVNGADGIIFAPNGNLLVGGQGNPVVHEITPTGTFVADGAANTASFHLTLDPNLKTVYTSDFGGALDVLPVGPPIQNGTTHAVSGDDRGVTQIAFGGGKVFYVDGSPNAFGNVGLIDISDLSNIQTTRLFTGLLPAHGMVFDPFTNLITMFGGGAVGTIDPSGATNADIISSLKTRSGINCDFDQGAVDGQGHALIAGCNSITFIDYRASGNIADPSNPTFVEFTDATGRFAFGGIDDVAPLSGAGSNPVPEPSSLVMVGTGLFVLAGFARRRRSRAV